MREKNKLHSCSYAHDLENAFIIKNQHKYVYSFPAVTGGYSQVNLINELNSTESLCPWWVQLVLVFRRADW